MRNGNFFRYIFTIFLKKNLFLQGGLDKLKNKYVVNYLAIIAKFNYKVVVRTKSVGSRFWVQIGISIGQNTTNNFIFFILRDIYSKVEPVADKVVVS
jgi:hypothetical protein